jgi:hypothetical protein
MFASFSGPGFEVFFGGSRDSAGKQELKPKTTLFGIKIKSHAAFINTNIKNPMLYTSINVRMLYRSFICSLTRLSL